MNYRTLGKTGYKVSEISFGSWAIGGSWGEVKDNDSLKALNKAVDSGINFFDTADNYGNGRSEKLLGQLKKDRNKDIIIATKAGRRLDPHVKEGYTLKNIENFVDRSLKNLQVERLDLLQLHCPPTEVYYDEEFFNDLNSLITKGKIAYLGVSVEKVEEAMKAIEYENVSTVQIIYNMFRLKPAEKFFSVAKENNIGILTRVPLASGLLTGKMSKDTKFAKDDHRNFNRHGEAFNKGETFSGVDYEKGLKAVEELKAIKPKGLTMAQFALRWILDNDAVSCAIPGAKNEKQVMDNVNASEAEKLSDDVNKKVKEIYDKYIREDVHHLW